MFRGCHKSQRPLGNLSASKTEYTKLQHEGCEISCAQELSVHSGADINELHMREKRQA